MSELQLSPRMIPMNTRGCKGSMYVFVLEWGQLEKEEFWAEQVTRDEVRSCGRRGAWDIPELEIMVVYMSLPTIDASLKCWSSSDSVTVSPSPMHV